MNIFEVSIETRDVKTGFLENRFSVRENRF